MSEFVVNFLNKDEKVITKGDFIEQEDDFFIIGDSIFRKENVDYIYKRKELYPLDPFINSFQISRRFRDD